MKQPFDYLNEYYDKIYVMTIHRATERHQKMKALLKGLNFTFFYGTDKLDWTVEKFIAAGIYDEVESMHKHRYGKKMSLGEVAAACTHKSVYEDVVKNNYQRVLIFEDDVVPDVQNLHLISGILQAIPADCELFYWGYDTKNVRSGWGASCKKWFYHLQHQLGLLKWNHTMIRNLFAQKINAQISQAGYHDFIHAFGLSYEGAKKLVAWQSPIVYCADTGISYAIMNELLKSYIAHPIIFNQEIQTNPDTYISLIK